MSVSVSVNLVPWRLVVPMALGSVNTKFTVLAVTLCRALALTESSSCTKTLVIPASSEIVPRVYEEPPRPVIGSEYVTKFSIPPTAAPVRFFNPMRQNLESSKTPPVGLLDKARVSLPDPPLRETNPFREPNFSEPTTKQMPVELASMLMVSTPLPP